MGRKQFITDLNRYAEREFGGEEAAEFLITQDVCEDINRLNRIRTEITYFHNSLQQNSLSEYCITVVQHSQQLLSVETLFVVFFYVNDERAAPSSCDGVCKSPAKELNAEGKCLDTKHFHYQAIRDYEDGLCCPPVKQSLSLLF